MVADDSGPIELTNTTREGIAMSLDMPAVEEGASRAQGEAWETAIEARGLLYHLERYAEEHPRTAALWCFAVGFFLGWRLKPW